MNETSEIVVIGDFAEKLSFVSRMQLKDITGQMIKATLHPFVVYYRERRYDLVLEI